MKQSLTYYLTLLVIKLKGVKKNFSQDPIDFKKIRKEDVIRPKGAFFKKHISKHFQISNTTITEIRSKNTSDKLLLFIHGGAFISGPGQHHWDAIKEIATRTDYTIWMCDYPKAPEHKISEISENIDALYAEALFYFKSDQISLLGDSVGGTLATALTQRLIAKKKSLPSKLILVCPVMDASMSNSEINRIDVIDPMLSKKGILSAKKMCVGTNELSDPIISPLHGGFEQFPKTILYVAENDIMYPDQKLAIEKFKSVSIDLEVINGKNMPHIWPYLPVMKEAKKALHHIIEILNRTSNSTSL